MRAKLIPLIFLMMTNSVFAGGFMLKEENDAFGFPKSDYDYTQGLEVYYIGDCKRESDGRIVRNLYGLKNFFYTPQDKSIAEPQPHDRPWAGITAGDFTTWTRDKDNFTITEWMLGVIGPWSQSGEIQAWFHGIIHNKIPKGWTNQVPNEPVLNYTYDTYHQIWMDGSHNGAGVDLTRDYGYSIGNAFVNGQCGLLGRAGWNIPNDYHTGLIMPTAVRDAFNISAYLFAGINSRFVFHNITIDGSLFQDSPHQELRNFIVESKAGAALTFRRIFGTMIDLDFDYTIIWRSKEFVEQKEAVSFGNITLAFMRGF